MDLRIFTEPQQGGTYDDLLRVARATQDLGFDAFFRSDHYLAFGAGPTLPGHTDAWTTLAGLARDTSRIKLGTLVTAATFRLPAPLAISVAQVDQMSGGRVELGIGAAWNVAEHTAYGIPFPDIAERFDRLEEQVAVIDGLLHTPAGDKFSFAGKHYAIVDAPALGSAPDARQVPIIIGGRGPKRTPALAARYAAEYNVPFAPVDDVDAAFERVRAIAAGRELVYSTANVVCVGRDDAELARRASAIHRDIGELRANSFAGTPGEVVDRIGRFAAIGATRLYLQVLDLTDLDHLELIASAVASQL
jgi:F420-dependent oxidoreductase-like protein